VLFAIPVSNEESRAGRRLNMYKPLHPSVTQADTGQILVINEPEHQLPLFIVTFKTGGGGSGRGRGANSMAAQMALQSRRVKGTNVKLSLSTLLGE
jgi:hypothetical protein